ncbi:MAG TPA: helix-turn-helix transcriptional regulator [Thermoanaerobaculia bacterium]|nr:helix-turn-helix transcriptional regulator [Thermoanaerobaculia bacterium]
MTDRYTEEARRLGDLLLSLAKTRKRSIRSLEKEMGVAASSLRKALTGEANLQVRHVLMIADALGIDWAELFQMAYPSRGAARPLRDPDGLQGDATDSASGNEVDLDEGMRRALLRALFRQMDAPPEGSTD